MRSSCAACFAFVQTNLYRGNFFRPFRRTLIVAEVLLQRQLKKFVFYPVAVRANQPALDPSSEQEALRQQAVLAGLAQFHYLGFVRMEEGWRKKGELAVLTKNDDLHVVRTGETVEDHVVVKAITQESVTLQDRQLRVEHTVPLSEEAPVQP